MATAATAFLDGLTGEQRPLASFPFESDERLKWHFIPTEMFPRKGLTIQAMSEPQRKLAHALLRSALSDRGYKTATAIMDLETVLAALEPGGKFRRDPERYFFAVFGTPSPRGAWGWRVEGHHVSLSVTVVNGSFVATSPMFFGTNPAEVRDGAKKGLRILGAEEDAARTLLTSLDASQRATAVINPAAPNDIATMNTVDDQPADTGRDRRVGAHAASARAADAPRRDLHVLDGGRSRGRSPEPRHERGPGEGRRLPGPAKPSAASATTTACRDRRS